MSEPRYSNDGISRHFDFDAVITGTSMVQNFRTSQFDELFGVNSVKLHFAGAGYEEISDSMGRTLKRNPGITTVFWAIDYNGLLRKPDWSQYEDYPTYLYDDNPFNDAAYVLNKSMLYHALLPDMVMTAQGVNSSTMDEYGKFDEPTGVAHVLIQQHDYTSLDHELHPLSDEDIKLVKDTFKTNFVDIVNQYPNTTFYMYFTPYSIYYWEYLNGTGQIERYIDAQTIATEMLLECPNVRLYTFFEKTDIICDLNYYSDEAHYSSDVNDWIMNELISNEYLVTKENYLDRISTQRDFFTTFDYDTYFTNLKNEVAKERENSN